MKAERYALVNGQVRKNVMNRLVDLPSDGTIEVVIQKVGTKSARQRGLQHIWYDDVVKSGLGGEYESGKDILDLACKYRWALPILVRDDTFFAEMYLAYSNAWKQDPERMKWWVKQNVHTEALSQNQMAEYLTLFKDHYVEMGVNLTDPEQRGWDNLLEIAA